MMYGRKARIGIIIPSSNNIMEPEFYAMKPSDVSFHFTRLPHQAHTSLDILRKMAAGTEEAANLLATSGVGIIAFGCTLGSLIEGPGWDQELIRRITHATGLKATTTSTAVIRALTALGVNKISIATPYGVEANNLEAQFFTKLGINVVNIRGIDVYGEEKHRLPPAATYELAREVDRPAAEAIFISCTGFKSITVIGQLERELNKPVISSNTATLWNILNMLGINYQNKRYGRLFG